MDYYDSNGWKVGKAGLPMKDWKASYRKWCRNDYSKPKNKGNPFLERLKKLEVLIIVFLSFVVLRLSCKSIISKTEKKGS